MLIVLYPTLTVPFATWIMIGYFSSIPKELDEAALIDGAGYMQILTKVFIPVALPGHHRRDDLCLYRVVGAISSIRSPLRHRKTSWSCRSASSLP